MAGGRVTHMGPALTGPVSRYSDSVMLLGMRGTSRLYSNSVYIALGKTTGG